MSSLMSSGIDRLPTEILEGVLLYLTAPDIRTCRSLYRRLKEIIDSSRLLFIAELDAAGYVESSNPRADLDTMGKYKYLHLHQTRQKSHIISSMETFKLGVLNGGFDNGSHALTGNHAPKLKGGVLAKWSSVNPISSLPLKLDVAQLASLNLGTESKQWSLIYEDMNIGGYDIEPACDLLVLLEYTGPVLNPRNRFFRPTYDPTGLGGNTPKPYVFHFRTLSTNEPHPSAARHLLDCGIITGNSRGFRVECLDEIVVARPKCAPSQDTSIDQCSGLVIYNWTTGALLDRKDELYTSRLVVLSDQVLVMPRSSFTFGSQNALMGELELYYIDWSDTSNPTMTHVAVLELPFVHSDSPLLPEHHFQTPAEAIAVHIYCHSDSSFSPTRPASYARGLARIFEPAKHNQLLRVRIQPPFDQEELFGELSLNERMSSDTSVYVPYHTVFSVVASGKNRKSGVERVHWENWAPNARWVHLGPEFWQGPSTSGTRCLLTRHSMDHRAVDRYGIDPNKPETFDVYLLDFNSMFVSELAHRDDQERTNGNSTSKWVYQPAEPDCFSPIAPNVGRRTWLAQCGAEKASAPYAWSKFKHEYFDTVVAQLQNTPVMFDDEHIVVIEADNISEAVSKIVVFNF